MKPPITVKEVELLHQEKTGEARQNPYLSLYRLSLQNTYSDGSQSAVYPYDAVLRKWLDAVAIILLCTIDGIPHICLRNCIRPPLLLRAQCALPIAELRPLHSLLELPAGLLEPEDVGEEGILRRAQMEIREETGYSVSMDRIQRMKSAPFISPGTIPERLWYVVAEIADPANRLPPTGDGSPVEENAEIEWVALESALRLCEDGAIDDMKTELGIRRIAYFVLRDGEKKE